MVFFIVFPIIFLLDYILTYIGISNNVILEANPILNWLFELPFLYGLIARMVIGAVFTGILWIGRDTKIFKIGYKVIFIVNSMVFTLHFNWIIMHILYH